MDETKNPIEREEIKPAGRKKNAARKAAEQGAYCIYLGPTGWGVRHGLVFRGTKEQAEKQLADIPGARQELAAMLVPKEQLLEARRRLKSGDCALALKYDELAAAMKKGAK